MMLFFYTTKAVNLQKGQENFHNKVHVAHIQKPDSHKAHAKQWCVVSCHYASGSCLLLLHAFI